jgi:hypothetical protein
MRTLQISDEDYKKVQEVLAKAEPVKKEVKKKTIIYKTDGSVLYESDKDTVKEAVVEAVSGGADLRGADLRGADLGEANLGRANLGEADLRGADLENAKFYGKGGTKPLKKEQVKDFLAALGFVIEED